MPSPFTIHVAGDAIADLARRLRHTRWPAAVAGSGWRHGSDLAYLQALCAYWAQGFDWRAQEALLNAMPQFTAQVEGYRMHFVHLEGRGPDPLPLVFTHGWPGSFYEVHKILGPLTDPAAHGGDPADAFTVVAPSLPGYGFSQIPTVPGYGPARTAELTDGLMRQLGYARYAAQGGDWGALVSAHLGLMYPERVVGAHMNMAFVGPVGDRRPRSPEEQQFLDAARAWRFQGGGYQHIQGTRPQTLAYGLTDSPAGLAAWITEKWRAWSDCGGDIESRFSKDEILTNLSIYWFTGTIGSSVRYYYELFQDRERNALGARIDVPCGFAVFPREIISAPRSWVARGCNLVHWSEFERGGHFAAMEEPALLAGDIRAFFRPLR